VETGTAWRAPTRRGACYFILPAISRVILLVFLLVSAAIDEENYFTFRWLWQWSSIGQGHQDKNINNNNNLHHRLDSRFSRKYSQHPENTRKSSLQLSVLLAFLLVSRDQTFTANFAIPNEGIERVARKNHGASANPKQIRTDVDCRAARPKFDDGAWSPAKIWRDRRRSLSTQRDRRNRPAIGG